MPLIPTAPVANQTVKEVSDTQQNDDSNAFEKNVRKEELTFETLQTVWYEFAEKRRQSGNSTTEEITLRREFKLQGTTIEIALDNTHQLEAVQNVRYELLSYVKSRINAPRLDINPRVAPQEVNRLPYTPAEKFNYMAEKNPYLLELKQALGLDVDF